MGAKTLRRLVICPGHPAWEKALLTKPSAEDLASIEKQASSAYRELKEAWYFHHVIPNHDGEDSDTWDAFYYPIGDAQKALNAFAALLEGNVPSTWKNERKICCPSANAMELF